MTKRNASLPVCHSDLGEGSSRYKLKKIPYRKLVRESVSSSKKLRSLLRSRPALAQSADVPRSLWTSPLAEGIAVGRQPNQRVQLTDYADFAKGTTGIRALQSIDIAVRHPESFAAMQDAIARLS